MLPAACCHAGGPGCVASFPGYQPILSGSRSTRGCGCRGENRAGGQFLRTRMWPLQSPGAGRPRQPPAVSCAVTGHAESSVQGKGPGLASGAHGQGMWPPARPPHTHTGTLTALLTLLGVPCPPSPHHVSGIAASPPAGQAPSGRAWGSGSRAGLAPCHPPVTTKQAEDSGGPTEN